MAHTDQTMRRVLRREIAGTIGLLTDEHDFRAMRRYRTFTFDDHAAYLRQVEALLRTRASQGTHTTVALFDPEDYAEFCSKTGLDPDLAATRTRYTAEIAAHGPTVPYDGQPLADLVPTLVDEAVRQATWEYAATLLSRLGTCATCGEDLGRAAFTRASRLLTRIVETAPAGHRHLVCSISTTPEALTSVLHADDDTEGGTELDEADALEFTAVLALGLATHTPGGLVMRTSAPGSPDHIYGWRLRGYGLAPLTAAEVFDPGSPDHIYGWRLRGYGLAPLTAAEVFDAYCTDVESGDLIAPESNVDYCAPPDLGDDSGAPGHRH